MPYFRSFSTGSVAIVPTTARVVTLGAAHHQTAGFVAEADVPNPSFVISSVPIVGQGVASPGFVVCVVSPYSRATTVS